MLLQIDGVVKRFDETLAVAGVSLAVVRGEIVCLLGPSGCGKTTLLRLIAGLESADSGTISFDNQSLKNVPPHKRNFGMMFQSFALFPHLNVFDNIGYGLQVRGDSRAAIGERVSEMLSLVDLSGYEQRAIDQLSGGEQQRVALARSLALAPQLLLLDEPLGALDRALRERLMLDLRRILKRVGVTAMYVTHDQSEAFAIADRIAIMREGRVVQVGSAESVYTRPKTAFVARFLGHDNVFEGKGERGEGKVLVRQEGIQWLREAGAETMPATIDAIWFRGRYYQLSCTMAWGTLMVELPRRDGWRVGDTAHVAIDSNYVLPLDSS